MKRFFVVYFNNDRKTFGNIILSFDDKNDKSIPEQIIEYFKKDHYKYFDFYNCMLINYFEI